MRTIECVRAPLPGLRHAIENCRVGSVPVAIDNNQVAVVGGRIARFAGCPGDLEKVSNVADLTVQLDAAGSKDPRLAPPVWQNADEKVLSSLNEVSVGFGAIHASGSGYTVWFGGDDEGLGRPTARLTIVETATGKVSCFDGPRSEGGMWPPACRHGAAVIVGAISEEEAREAGVNAAALRAAAEAAAGGDKKKDKGKKKGKVEEEEEDLGPSPSCATRFLLIGGETVEDGGRRALDLGRVWELDLEKVEWCVREAGVVGGVRKGSRNARGAFLVASEEGVEIPEGWEDAWLEEEADEGVVGVRSRHGAALVDFGAHVRGCVVWGGEGGDGSVWCLDVDRLQWRWFAGGVRDVGEVGAGLRCVMEESEVGNRAWPVMVAADVPKVLLRDLEMEEDRVGGILEEAKKSLEVVDDGKGKKKGGGGASKAKGKGKDKKKKKDSDEDEETKWDVMVRENSAIEKDSLSVRRVLVVGGRGRDDVSQILAITPFNGRIQYLDFATHTLPSPRHGHIALSTTLTLRDQSVTRLLIFGGMVGPPAPRPNLARPLPSPPSTPNNIQSSPILLRPNTATSTHSRPTSAPPSRANTPQGPPLAQGACAGDPAVYILELRPWDTQEDVEEAEMKEKESGIPRFSSLLELREAMHSGECIVQLSEEGGGEYRGSSTMGKRWGHGRAEWGQGQVYEGEWFDGLPHGTGVATWPDGTLYQGSFRAGRRHGKGVYRSVKKEEETPEEKIDFEGEEKTPEEKFDFEGEEETTKKQGVDFEGEEEETSSKKQSFEGEDDDDDDGSSERIVSESKDDGVDLSEWEIVDRKEVESLSSSSSLCLPCVGSDVEEGGIVGKAWRLGVDAFIVRRENRAPWFEHEAGWQDFSKVPSHVQSMGGYSLGPVLVYDGAWEEDRPCGFGVGTFENGWKYEGRWNGLQHGWGKLFRSSVEEQKEETPEKKIDLEGEEEKPEKEIDFEGEEETPEKEIDFEGEEEKPEKKIDFEGEHETTKKQDDEEFVRYEGEFAFGVPHGEGKEDGTVEWSVGESMVGVYEGGFCGGLRHGKGRMVWDLGGDYRGGWKWGRRCGEGEERTASGERYVGKFVNGRRHGLGRCAYPDGGVFEGVFLNGARHGQGLWVGRDGAVASGMFQEDVLHGQGAVDWSTGARFEGAFERGSPAGKGIVRIVAGDPPRLVKEYTQGQEVGAGIYFPAAGRHRSELEEESDDGIGPPPKLGSPAVVEVYEGGLIRGSREGAGTLWRVELPPGFGNEQEVAAAALAALSSKARTKIGPQLALARGLGDAHVKILYAGQWQNDSPATLEI